MDDSNRQVHNEPSIEPPFEQVPGAWLRYRVWPDGTGRIEHVSSGGQALWEITAAQCRADPTVLMALVDVCDLPGLTTSLAESRRQRCDWSFQWGITTPSGRRKRLHGVGRPQNQGDGGTLWHVFIVELTPHQPVPSGPSASEARFRQLIDGIPNVAVQGYDDQLICRFWNQASERLYGFTEAEAVGTSLLDLIIPEPMRADVVAAAQQMMASGQAIPAAELVLQRKGGQPVSVYSSHVLLQREGHAPEFFCIDYDLTERQAAESTRLQLQSQLRESQKMEALGTLAGGVAHDFNNIVAAILGNVELALGDVPDSNPALTSLHEIRKAGRRARDLVQQILAFSRRQESVQEPTCLRTVLEDTHRLLRATLPSELQLTLRADPEVPLVMANATQIQQVVLNLTTNALQAVKGQAQAHVQLRLERIEQPDVVLDPDNFLALPMPTDWPGQGVRLTVTDSGGGMNPETLLRIFEPFFTTKAPGAGTGLGLAVVHSILREHRAGLSVRSRLGAGTAFTAVFPGLADTSVQAPRRMAAETTLTPKPRGKGPAPHVVYVDDDEAIAFLVRRLLQRHGYRVTAFTDPQQALDALRQAPLDVALCITDYNMPGMSGLRLTRELKALHPTLPVAITSGYINEELRQGAPDAGAEEVIFKPDTVEALCAAIERLLKV